jgi:hypothetical protein
MRIMRNIFLIINLLALLFLKSCALESDRKIPLDKSLELSVSSLDIRDFSENVEVIDIETTDSSLIATVDDIRINSDHIAIVSMNRCLLFDRNGKFIRKIGAKGRAINEYLYITDVFPFENSIWLVDESGRKVMKYDYSGNFIESISLAKYREFTSVFFTSDKEFILFIPDYGTRQHNNMLVFYKDGINYDSIPHNNPIESEAYVRFYFREGQFCLFDKGVTFKSIFNDTIYRINNSVMTKYFISELGNSKAIPDARVKIFSNTEPLLMKKMAKVFLIGESSVFLLLNINDEYYFFNKREGEIIKTNLFLENSNNSSENKAKIKIHNVSGENIVATTSGINENDNPRVIIARLKTK